VGWQSSTENGTTTNGTKETDLNLYILEQNTLSKNINAMDYWLSKCDQYKNISNLALDLISTPAS